LSLAAGHHVHASAHAAATLYVLLAALMVGGFAASALLARAHRAAMATAAT
jgi:hypothetical protein